MREANLREIVFRYYKGMSAYLKGFMTQLRITEDIQPLTAFRNNSVEMMRQLRETQRPIILTVNGKAEAVVLGTEAYQRLMDLVAQADEGEALRRAEEERRLGLGRPAREVLEEIRVASGIPG